MSTKSKWILTLFLLANAAIVPAASADPLVGAAIGAGVGAVAGHAVSGRDGALVGGALGAVAGYQIGKHHSRSNPRRHVSSLHYQQPVRHYRGKQAYHGHRHTRYYRDQNGRLIRYK
jgi:uncharacterized protein YcfJ